MRGNHFSSLTNLNPHLSSLFSLQEMEALKTDLGLIESKELDELVSHHIDSYYPTPDQLNNLSWQILSRLTTPETRRNLASTSLKSLLLTTIETLVRTHWTALAVEVNYLPHPATEYDLLLYHANCPDGLASAWCFWRHNNSLETVPMTHGKPPPDVSDRKVMIVDFSFKRPILEELKLKSSHLRILDHHKSAEEELRGLDYCTFDMSRAGCEMAWDFTEGETPRPYFLQAIADHDVWRQNPRSEAICKALHKRKMMNFEGFNLLMEDANLEYELVAEGKILMEVDESLIAKALKYSRLYRFREYQVRIGIPPPGLRSEFGHAMCLVGDCDFSLTWQYSLEENEFWCSARSMDHLVDVSAIAKLFGGGGHRNASGFTIYGKDGENVRSYFTPV